MNLSRLRFHAESGLLIYEPKAGQEVDDSEPIDPLEFIARVLIHIPEPNKHLVHFYGAYANRSRSSMPHARDAEQNKAEGEGEAEPAPAKSSPSPHPYDGFWRTGTTTLRDKELLPTRPSPSIDAYPLNTRSWCVLNLVNRLRCPRTGTAAILLSLAIRPDEF